MKSCTCIKYEDQGILPDPTCSVHREEEKSDMGEHSGEKRSFLDAIKPPEKFNRKQLVSWYIGLVIGAILICAALVFVGALLIGLVRLFFALVAWLVG